MAVQIDLSRIPPAAQLEVSIHLSSSLHVSAAEARRRASRLVASEIGNLLYGGEPTLRVGERICWSVPILLAFPDSGSIGQVGAVDVDAETGAALTSTTQLEEIAAYAVPYALVRPEES
jgi:hypothetical protein